MDEKLIHRMYEHYRHTRKLVFNEATRPFSNDADKHNKNKKKLESKIKTLCNNANLKEYEGYEKSVASAIWHILWTRNRYAGIKSKIASKEIDDIAGIFDNFEMFNDKNWDIEASGYSIIRAGQGVFDFLNRDGLFTGMQTIGNIPKLVKIVSIARQLSSFLHKKDKDVNIINFISNGNNKDDIWEIHHHLMEIGYKGDLTALHFMMDVGYQVIKPDIIISRLFLKWGWLHAAIPSLPIDLEYEDLQGKGKYGNKYIYTNRKMYIPAINLARQIIGEVNTEELISDIGWATDNPIREFDIFMVKYGQQPEAHFGIERTLHKRSNIDYSMSNMM